MFTHDIEDYELKLDKPCVFTRGLLNEESPCTITGRFCLRLSKAIWLKGIRVRLIGLLRVPRDDYLIRNDREVITFERDQALASSKTLQSFQMPAGNYEFSFGIPLPCEMMDTVTGIRNSYHSYNVQILLSRRFKSDFIVSKPVRIYNSPILEINHPQPFPRTVVQCQTDDGMQYCVSIPDTNIPFGCSFPVECWFAPLRKDLRLSSVTISVSEKHRLKIAATAAETAMHNILNVTSTRNHNIFTETYDLSEPTASSDTNSAPLEWNLNKTIQLPCEFNTCSQTVSTKSIKIAHTLIVTAEFQSPGGKILSKIEENIPFSIYMTSALIGEDGVVHRQDFRSLQNHGNPPPSYGHHNSDRMLMDFPPDYSGVPSVLNSIQIRCGQALNSSTFFDAPDCDPPLYDTCCTI